MKSTPLKSDSNYFGWFFCCIGVSVGLLLSAVTFSEFYAVRIQKNAGAYAFGNINENQWYYQSEDIYWKYMLISGIAFLIVTLFTLVFMIRKSLKWSLVGTGIIAFLFVVLLINAAPN